MKRDKAVISAGNPRPHSRSTSFNTQKATVTSEQYYIEWGGSDESVACRPSLSVLNAFSCESGYVSVMWDGGVSTVESQGTSLSAGSIQMFMGKGYKRVSVWSL